jgi:hypothetical protein
MTVRNSMSACILDIVCSADFWVHAVEDVLKMGMKEIRLSFKTGIYFRTRRIGFIGDGDDLAVIFAA